MAANWVDAALHRGLVGVLAADAVGLSASALDPTMEHVFAEAARFRGEWALEKSDVLPGLRRRADDGGKARDGNRDESDRNVLRVFAEADRAKSADELLGKAAHAFRTRQARPRYVLVGAAEREAEEEEDSDSDSETETSGAAYVRVVLDDAGSSLSGTGGSDSSSVLPGWPSLA